MKNSLKSNSGTCPVKSQISHLSQAGINLFYLDRFNKMKSLSKFGESWRWMYSKIAEHLEQRSKSVLKLRLYKWGIMTTFDNRNIFKIWKKQNKSTKHFFLLNKYFRITPWFWVKINLKWEELTVIFCFWFFKNVSVDGETL